ncbi:C40 family peptidase [Nocardia sp. GCM10030253]|uniref:C40 family peptidase n=1 Tax=Nocardia sp. GCM10030253 TaxID=3273404 RepID=UPI003624F91E
MASTEDVRYFRWLRRTLLLLLGAAAAALGALLLTAGSASAQPLNIPGVGTFEIPGRTPVPAVHTPAVENIPQIIDIWEVGTLPAAPLVSEIEIAPLPEISLPAAFLGTDAAIVPGTDAAIVPGTGAATVPGTGAAIVPATAATVPGTDAAIVPGTGAAIVPGTGAAIVPGTGAATVPGTGTATVPAIELGFPPNAIRIELPFLSGMPWAQPLAPAPAPAPTVTAPKSPGAVAVDAARSKLGADYIMGADGPDAFDCSGLVQWSYGQAGVDTPRTSYQQLAAGTPVSVDELQPGDVVSFYGGGHSALYSGEGKVIHASTYGTGVIESDMASMPYASARRY